MSKTTATTADDLLDLALRRGASDLHLEPTAAGLDVRLRVDGHLHRGVRTLTPGDARAATARLMSLAGLLSYHPHVPQEGRLDFKPAGAAGPIALRVSVMPTPHGPRVAVRLPARNGSDSPGGSDGAPALDALGLPPQTLAALRRWMAADSGMLLLIGPAGAGKTTTAHALLSALAAPALGLSVVSLEDPVERDLPGVTQIQIEPFGQLTYAVALRSLLRQDPQVLGIGEIRDAQTAALAADAALAGHRLVTTLHAGNPARALVRLTEMGVEPYRVTSGVSAVVGQRLLRRSGGGRVPVAEAVEMTDTLRRGVIDGLDAAALDRLCPRDTLHDAAARLIADGVIDPAEAERVLGPPC